MGEKRAYKPRKPGGGRKKLKPEYDARKNLKEQMERAVALYDYEMSLQAIGEELGLNPIKVRKLLITAGVYDRMWPRRYRIHLRSAEKHKTTKPPYSQPQILFNFPKPPSPRTCLIRKACIIQVQRKKRLVLEQSGSGDTER